MNYSDVLRTIYARDGKSSYYTLGRIKRAARGLGNPQEAFTAVHITGSNGKGSVARMIFEMLHRSGLKTALFTSPHLHRYSERIRIGRREIPRREVIKRFEEIERLRLAGKIGWITFFEITTLIAFGWFADEKVDVAVLEVGLGGRLDATNICRSCVNVITTIGLEHTNILGPTLSDIAREKAGIIKGKAPVIIGRLPPVADRVVRRRAAAMGARVRRLGVDFFAELESEDGCTTFPFSPSFSYRGPVLNFDRLYVSLPGVHQVDNAAMACAAAEELIMQGMALSRDVIPVSLRAVRWEGRLETISRDPEVILDCAHNLPAVRNLVKELDGRKFHVVFGALRDKPIEKMFAKLRPLIHKPYISVPKVHRAPSLDEIRRRCGHLPAHNIFSTVSDAVDAAVKEARASGLPVLVTGSIFVVSEARAHYLGLRNVDPPLAM